MFFLIRRLTQDWRSATRARLLYIVMSVAFGGFAVVAIVSGNAAVAIIATGVGIVTLGLAFIAPKLASEKLRTSVRSMETGEERSTAD